MPEFKTETVGALPYLYTEGHAAMRPEEMSKAMGAAFGKVMAHMQAQDIEPAGPSLSVYYSFDPDKVDFRAGFVVAADDLKKAQGEVKGDKTPAGQAVCFIHEGPYEKLSESYGAMMGWMQQQGLEMGAPCVELYLTDPDTTPPEDLRTEIRMMLA